MADRIEPFVLPIPAATPLNAPIVLPTSFLPGIVTRVSITVPPGPSGLMGFLIQHKGQPLIPYLGGTFFVADNRTLTWAVTNMPTNTGWEFLCYNTDIYPHSLYIEYEIDEIPPPVAVSTPLVSIAQA